MKRSWWIDGRRAALALTLAALVAACSINTVTGPTTATGGNATNNQPGGGNGASPSPGSGGDLPVGAYVRQGLYGQACPNGTTPPSNGLRTVLLNCTGFLTATPKYQDGSDIPAAVHGPTIAWAITLGQSVVILLTPPEPFNRDVKCNSAGPFALSATVKNVTGSADYSCATSAPQGLRGLGAGMSQSTLGDRVYFWYETDENGLPLATAALKADAIKRDRFPQVE